MAGVGREGRKELHRNYFPANFLLCINITSQTVIHRFHNNILSFFDM